MKELHLVGFTDDRDGLIFATRSGTASGGFKVVIDEALVDHVEELRAELGLPLASPGRRSRTAPRGRSALSPREMQSRLRGGLSIAEVADEAGVDPSWVERFAAPVLAEQANAVDQAVRFPLSSTRRGTSGTTLADAVAANLADRGLPVTERTAADGWSAHHHHGTQWRVRFTFRQRGRELQAEWLADLADKTLTAVNRLGTELGYTESDEEAAGEAGHDGPPVRALRGRVAADARVRPSPVAGLARSATPAPAEARRPKVAEPGPTPAEKEKQTAKKAAARERAAAKQQGDREKAAAKKEAARQREAERKATRAEKEVAKKEAAKVKAAAKRVAERERAAARRLAAQESDRLRKADLAAKEAAKREAAEQRAAAKEAKREAEERKAAEQRAAAEPPPEPAPVAEEPEPIDGEPPPVAATELAVGDTSSADLTMDPAHDEGQQLTFDEPKAEEDGAPKLRSKLGRRRRRRATEPSAAEEPTAASPSPPAEDHAAPAGMVAEVPFSGAAPLVAEPELPQPPAFPAAELAGDAPGSGTVPAMEPTPGTVPAMEPTPGTVPAMEPTPGTVPAMEPTPGTVPAIDPVADVTTPPEPSPAPPEAAPIVVEVHPELPAPEPPALEPPALEGLPPAAVAEPKPSAAALPPHLVPLPPAEPDDAPTPTRQARRARRSPALREGGPRRPLRSTQEARAVAARRKEEITGVADPTASETTPTIRATRAADAGERADALPDDTKAADHRPDPSP